MNYSIHQTTWALNSSALKSIRTQVFIVEQQVTEADEWDHHDENAIHFIVVNDKNEPLGCARLISENKNGLQAFHIGRVAVLKAYRTQGIGRRLMQFVISYAQNTQPESPIYLHAQVSRQTFYEHLRFLARGEIFMDANIPHIEMWYKS